MNTIIFLFAIKTVQLIGSNIIRIAHEIDQKAVIFLSRRKSWHNENVSEFLSQWISSNFVINLTQKLLIADRNYLPISFFPLNTSSLSLPLFPSLRSLHFFTAEKIFSSTSIQVRVRNRIIIVSQLTSKHLDITISIQRPIVCLRLLLELPSRSLHVRVELSSGWESGSSGHARMSSSFS